MGKAISGVRLLPLSGGFSAVLLFLVIAVDGATRPGYDAWHHGVSQLVLGELGWLERLVYVLCGLLIVVFAVGAKRLLASGPGAKWVGGSWPRSAWGWSWLGCSPPIRRWAIRSVNRRP